MFNFIFKSRDQRIKALEAENLQLESRVASLSLSSDMIRPKIKMNLGDPIPENQTARREYVARVASFHKDILGPKIHAVISDSREDLEKIENPSPYDLLLKGSINALWLLWEWGEQSVNEMISYQVEAEDTEDFKIIRDRLNNKDNG